MPPASFALKAPPFSCSGLSTQTEITQKAINPPCHNEDFAVKGSSQMLAKASILSQKSYFFNY